MKKMMIAVILRDDILQKTYNNNYNNNVNISQEMADKW